MAQQICNQFEPTTNTSSATICKWCGQEKFLHAPKVGNMAQQTAVEWLVEQLIPKAMVTYDTTTYNAIQQAKAMEKEQNGYTEEQAYEIWKAGQKYWETSGSSITFEELIEKLKNK